MATGLKNLKIYQMACELELEVFEITKIFPEDEKYRSVDQLRRSSSAVTNNIAEAYNKQSSKQKIHILRDIAIGEAEETMSNLLMCAKKDFLQNQEATLISEKYRDLQKATNGFIRFLRVAKIKTDKL